MEKYHNPLVAEGELIKKNHGSQNVFGVLTWIADINIFYPEPGVMDKIY